MTVPRFIMACFVASVLHVSPEAAAEEPQTEPNSHDVISRLDKTLQRLDQIERRIARLENMFFPTSRQPDKHGIIRDPSGRPIIIWGIDYPAVEERVNGIIRDASGRPIGIWGIDYPPIEERVRR